MPKMMASKFLSKEHFRSGYMSRPRIKNSSEKRTERVSLVLTPDAYQAVAILAQIQGISVNNLIASILDGVIEKNATVIEKFNTSLIEARADVTLEV